MATISPTLSVKSSSCTFSSSKRSLNYSKTVSSSCSVMGTPKFQSLSLSSSFLCSPNQIIKLKSVSPRSTPLRRAIGGLEIKMSVEAGVGVMGFKEGNIVTQVKTESTDGYNAVQVGYERVRDRKLTMPELGHLNKSGVIPMRHLQEFRLVSVDDFTPSQKILFEDLFKEGDLVDVSGTTIGKGFQGGIKRHNFKRGLMTHGSKSHRALGSIGAGTTPGHVYKGKKMPGRMGGTKTKIRKLKIMKVDTDLRVVMIKGALPGKPGNLLRLAPAKIVGKNIPKN
uniref:Large ribosomal subunit protein uL3c n=1 Tax=Chenopodium quinoa TaxID=63459 RepID=A0A803MZU8_CHEQI